MCLLQTSSVEWERHASTVRESVALTQANGAILCSISSQKIGPWFTELIRELSHNVPLDLAVKWSTERLKASSLLAASPQLIAGMLLSVVAQRVSERLHQASPRPLTVDEDMSRHLGMLPGQHSSDNIAHNIRERLESFRFLYESDEATTISRISREANRLLRFYLRDSPFVSGPRWLNE